MHKLDLMGFSGFEVNLVKLNECYYIEKSTDDILLKERLKKQFEKQKQYFDIIEKCQLKKLFRVPKITKFNNCKDSFTFQMEYSNSFNYLDFFENSSVHEIENALESIFIIIEKFISISDYTTIDNKVIKNKYLDTKNNIISKQIANNNFFKDIDNLFTFKHDLFLPIGFCHGDLTFSNMLFDGINKKIVLIDFLDSFIESPILDIVKLRQDTNYLWSTNFYKKDFDIVKTKIIFNHIDNKIHNYFSKYEFYLKYYSTFQILNLLRVLQYAKDEKIIKILKKNIDDEKLNYSRSR